jgi:hypothetical protein
MNGRTHTGQIDGVGRVSDVLEGILTQAPKILP